jgi:very-short-patch-repair endonuclease
MIRGERVLSCLEIRVRDALNRIGIPYEAEWPTRNGFLIDFAFLKSMIALEVDGPHHDSPMRRKKDGFRTQCLKQFGWRVVRLHHSILDSLSDGQLDAWLSEKLG